MKSNKKGISLIVLVITIIVIIILAAAIILSLNNNNPIAQAKNAVTASDKAEAQSAITTWIGSLMAEELDVVSIVDEVDIEDTDTTVTITVGTGDDATTKTVTTNTTKLGLDGVTSITVENNKVTNVSKN